MCSWSADTDNPENTRAGDQISADDGRLQTRRRAKHKKAAWISRYEHTHPAEDGKEAEGYGGSGGVGPLCQRQLLRRGRLPLIGQKTEANKPQEAGQTLEEGNTGLLDERITSYYKLSPGEPEYVLNEKVTSCRSPKWLACFL